MRTQITDKKIVGKAVAAIITLSVEKYALGYVKTFTSLVSRPLLLSTHSS